jgi:hypothetical protein
MKYLKTFESVDQFDLALAITRIKEKYSEDEVASKYDDELLNWVDSDWENDGDYESEYDWYIDYNNGEAQDVVIDEMINWYKKTYNKDISDDDYSNLFDEIKSEYNL